MRSDIRVQTGKIDEHTQQGKSNIISALKKRVSVHDAYLENLFDGVNVSCRPQVKTQIVFHGGFHDSLQSIKVRVKQ